MIIMIITSRILGAAGKGEISLFVANLAMIQLFNNFIGGTSIVYLVPRSSAFQLAIPAYIWAIISCFTSSIAIFYLTGLKEEYLWHLFFISLLEALMRVHMLMLVGKEDIKIHNFISLLQTALVLMCLLVFFFMLNEQKVIYYIYSLYVAFTTSYFVAIIFSKNFFNNFSLKGFRTTLKDVVKIGITAQYSNIITFLNYRLSYYILSKYHGNESVGVYSNGVSVSEALWMISSSIALVQYSKIVNTKNKTYAQQMSVMLAKACLAITAICLLPLVALPSEFYVYVLGKDFYEVNKVIMILSPGILAIAVTRIFSHYFGGLGRYHINNYASMAGLAATIGGGILLVPAFGITGAALTSTISYLASSAFLFILFVKDSNTRLQDFIIKKEDLGMLKEKLKLK